MTLITHGLARTLVATAVAMSGLPTAEHSHPGGERPHDHRGHRHHAGAPVAATDSLAPSRAHRHVSLFGFDLSVPVDESDGERQIARLALLVQSFSLTDAQQSSGPLFDRAPQLCEPAQPASIELVFRGKMVFAAPLCDTARHERSGVQRT